MSPETTISLSVILSIISAIGVIVSISMSLRKAHGEEEERRIEIEKQFVKINLKLDDFCTKMNEFAKNSEKSMDELKNVNISLARCNERIETLFKYKDDHEKRIEALEDDNK